jgi:hypothetical protein
VRARVGAGSSMTAAAPAVAQAKVMEEVG